MGNPFFPGFPRIDLTAVNLDYFIDYLQQLGDLVTDLQQQIQDMEKQPVPIATATQAGIVKASDDVSVAADGSMIVNSAASADSVQWADVEGKPGIASAAAPGFVKPSTSGRVTVAADGTLNAPLATTAQPGMVKGGGTGIMIAADGTISATGDATATNVEWAAIQNVPIISNTTAGIAKTSPIYGVNANSNGELLLAYATSSITGGVRNGGNVSVSATNGTLNYDLPAASTTTLGGVKLNAAYAGLNAQNELIIHAADEAASVEWENVQNVPTASTEEAGVMVVAQDQDTACYMLNGALRTRYATANQCGAVRVGTGLRVSGGTMGVAVGTVTGTLSGTTLTLTLAT